LPGQSKWGGTSHDGGNSIALDAFGNVYTTGHFEGTADIDPGAGVFNLTSAGLYDIFISKLDASGNFAWAKAMGGAGYEYGLSIALDADGNVYTTGGFFSATVDFDPGGGVLNLTSAGGYDIFISKLDASGNFAWAKAMGGTTRDQAGSIALDDSGNVYTTGYFHDTPDFDPGAGVFNLTSAGNSDIFVHKMSQATGISENEPENAVVIYPNPTAGTFTVQGTATDIQVHDLFGRVVLHTIEPQIDMSHQSKGIYFVKAGDAVRKLVLH